MLDVSIAGNNKNTVVVKRLLLISVFVAMFFVAVLMISKGVSAAGFDLAASEGAKNAYQCETTTFTMNATSVSSSSITANITSTYPAGWEAPIHQSTLNIPANGSRTFAVSVPVPSTATPGAYYANITLTDTSNTSQTAQCPLRVNVLQTVNASCSEPTHTTKPGSEIAYTVKIWNKGTSTDSDTISLTVNKTNAAWNASISSNSVSLKGGEYQNVVVTIIPPLTAALNESVVATVTAKFDTGSKYLGAYNTVDLTTTVSQKYGLILYGCDNITCTPGVSANYTLNISNTGNGYDTYIMTATENAEWISFGGYQQIIVGPNQTTSIPVTVTVKSGTLIGGYTITLKGVSKYDATAAATKSVSVTASQVYGVNITSDTVYASVLPGLFSETTINTTTFNITVTNTGNGPDIIDIQTTGPYANWSTLNISRVVLGANKSAQLSLAVNISAGTTAGDYNITTVANSVADTSKTSTLTFLLKASQNYGSNIVCLDASNEVNPSIATKTTYALVIWNTGNGQDTIHMNITSAPQGWANLSDSSVVLSPNANQSILLTVDVPLGTPAGNYTVNVSATPNMGRSNTSSTMATITKVLPVYGVRLSAAAISTSTYPGTNVTFPITIINTGTGADSVSFGIAKPSTWDARMNIPAEIGYGKNASADLILTIPAGEQSSAVVGSYNITLIGTSVGDSSKTSSLTFSVYVNSQYGVEIGSGPNQTAKPGEAITYPITITNTGNIRDTIDLSVVSKPANWNVVFLSGSAPVSSLTLSAKAASTGLSVTVSVPSTESANGTVVIAAKSQGDATKSASASISTTIRVPSYGVKLHSSNLNQSASPGNKATYAVSVGNTGDTADVFLLTVTKPSTLWEVSLFDEDGKNISAVTLQASADKNILVTVTPPSSTAADIFNVEIAAVSQNSSKVSATIKLNVSVQPVRNTVLKIVGQTPARLDPNIEQSIGYSLVFSNAGNTMENMTFSVTAPTGWSLRIDGEKKTKTSTFSLDSGKETTSNLTLIVSDTPPTAGDNLIYITADMENGYRVEKTITITVIKPNLAIYASEITFSNPNPTEGENILIGAVVRNTGTADATGVQLLFYDGSTPLGSTIVDVAAGGNTPIQYPWAVTKGVHAIKVKIGGEIIQSSYAQNANTSKPITGEEKSLIFFTKSATLSNIRFIGAGAGAGIVLMCIIWGAAALRRRGKEKEKRRIEEEKKYRRKESQERWKEIKSSTVNIESPPGRPRPQLRPQVRVLEPTPRIETKPIEAIEKKEKPVYVKCPKCGELREIKTAHRPIQVTCSRCGTKIGVKK